MRETLETPQNNSHSNTFRNMAVTSALCTALSSCTPSPTKGCSVMQKAARLEYKLQKQAENYHKVYVQENIQQDLKAEGADPTINQEIGYALNFAAKQDKKIARTKRRLKRTQKRIARMEQRGQTSFSDGLNTRLTDKYDYISEEFNRTQQAQ